MYREANNTVTITGIIQQPFEKHHMVMGESFYRTFLDSQRYSETIDTLPIIVSDRLMDVQQDCSGKYVTIHGSYRSFNERPADGSRSKLILYIFATEIEIAEEVPSYRRDSNDINLDGYICKEVVYRKTPLGREIADMLVAVNRQYGHSDYIPCICWGRNAKYVAELPVGTHLDIYGRIQSRPYIKKHEDGTLEDRIAYEVSVQRVDAIEDEEEAEEE